MADMRSSERRVVCPGSFDPLTLGHVDLVRRATTLFDRVILAVLVNDEKAPLLSKTERVALAREVFAGMPQVEVDTYDGLLVDYAARRGAIAIVRGVRSAVDLEYEWPMRLMNHYLQPSIDTVFLPTAAALAHVSSRLVKEVWRLGGEVGGLVPPEVEARLRALRGEHAPAR
jgi:pantetheine-phosphate adenylyltransferase